jgi:hypothetical protein
MSALTIVEDLDVLEDSTPRFIPSLERAVINEFIFK